MGLLLPRLVLVGEVWRKPHGWGSGSETPRPVERKGKWGGKGAGVGKNGGSGVGFGGRRMRRAGRGKVGKKQKEKLIAMLSRVLRVIGERSEEEDNIDD